MTNHRDAQQYTIKTSGLHIVGRCHLNTRERVPRTRPAYGRRCFSGSRSHSAPSGLRCRILRRAFGLTQDLRASLSGVGAVGRRDSWYHAHCWTTRRDLRNAQSVHGLEHRAFSPGRSSLVSGTSYQYEPVVAERRDDPFPVRPTVRGSRLCRSAERVELSRPFQGFTAFRQQDPMRPVLPLGGARADTGGGCDKSLSSCLLFVRTGTLSVSLSLSLSTDMCAQV